jgi:hypothetical protein
VLPRAHHDTFLSETSKTLEEKGIGFYYGESFPEKFEL